MTDPEQYPEITDHKDTLLNMSTRRILNEVYAEHPVDFNVEGLIGGQKLAERPLTIDDIIVDIGSGNGNIPANAALQSGVKATILCVENDPDALMYYNLLSLKLNNRISLISADGEQLPFKDSSVFGATLHNVIFRANDARKMLREAQRVVKPGGFIAISSNAQGHAHYRHSFESIVAHKVMKQSGVRFIEPTPPAQKQYLEDLPLLFEKVGNLQIMGKLFVPQITKSIITMGQPLDNYVDAIKFSAVNFEVPGHLRELWRQTVEDLVRSEIENELEVIRINQITPSDTEPFFSDTIRRGMFVLRNEKPTA